MGSGWIEAAGRRLSGVLARGGSLLDAAVRDRSNLPCSGLPIRKVLPPPKLEFETDPAVTSGQLLRELGMMGPGSRVSAMVSEFPLPGLPFKSL